MGKIKTTYHMQDVIIRRQLPFINNLTLQKNHVNLQGVIPCNHLLGRC